MSPTAGPLRGFILTRDWRDTVAGTELEFWVATDQGTRRIRVGGQRATAFVRASQKAKLEAAVAGTADAPVIKPVLLKALDQEPVAAVYVEGYRRMLQLRRRLEREGIELLEADIRPSDRFLMERFITSSILVDGGIADGPHGLVDPVVKAADRHRPVLGVVALDIETSGRGELYSIALEGLGDRRVLMLDPGREDTDRSAGFDLEYRRTRADLIRALNAWFARHDPDVIIGWNVVQFDLLRLQECADACGVPLALGRDARPIEWRRHNRRDGFVFASIPGRLAIDGIEALKSALQTFRSYSLEAVGQALLGEGKSIEDDRHGKLAEIERRFQEDKPALAAYNLRDCELTTRIFERARILDFMLERANVTGLQADQSGGSIAAFSHLYLPRMHREGYVASNVSRTADDPYPGGFVIDSIPGLYDSVLVLDYKSLYPSIIRTFLVDPVGLAEGRANPDAAQTIPGPNGTRFSRTKHCLPKIIGDLWSDRDRAKKDRNEPLSQALKLLMNAFVGVLGAPGGRFYDRDLAAAATLRGHEIIKQTRVLVEAEGYRVIYGDTDSVFVWLRERHDDASADEIAQGLVSRINAWWRDHLADTLGLHSHLEIEFDVHYRRFFMPTIRGSDQGSKKRYAGLVTSEAGADELVFRGLETARSDWTPLAQTFQQELFRRIFLEQPYDGYVRDYVSRLRAGSLDASLVYRKRIRGSLASYDRTTPPPVRAARLADELNSKNGRPLQYQGGGWIEYVMTVNGPEPLEAARSPLDREHYVTNQLEPIADSILPLLGDRFGALVGVQAEFSF